MKGNNRQFDLQNFLVGLHDKFKEEVLEVFMNQISNISADIGIRSALHIETLHYSLHVLTGGEISSIMTATVRPNTLSSHNILLYFNIFKGLADGSLKTEDFDIKSYDYTKIKTVKHLLDGEAGIVKRIILKTSLDIATQGEEFDKYCQQISRESRDFIKFACQWVEQLVQNRDIESFDYVNKVIKTKILVGAEGFDKTSLTNAQKIYSISNVNVNIVDNDGVTPIGHAVQNGDVKTIRELIKAGGDINIPMNCKENPVYLAALKGRADILTFLISEGGHSEFLEDSLEEMAVDNVEYQNAILTGRSSFDEKIGNENIIKRKVMEHVSRFIDLKDVEKKLPPIPEDISQYIGSFLEVSDSKKLSKFIRPGSNEYDETTRLLRDYKLNIMPEIKAGRFPVTIKFQSEFIDEMDKRIQPEPSTKKASSSSLLKSQEQEKLLS